MEDFTKKSRLEMDISVIESLESVFEDTPITDEIYLDDEQIGELFKLWQERSNVKKDSRCPSDLFFADTIPLPNVTIYAENKKMELVLFPDRGMGFQGDTAMTVGAMRITDLRAVEFTKPCYYTTVISYEDINYMVGLPLGSRQCVEALLDEVTKQSLVDIGNIMTNLWYTIQICLLNPVTQVIISKPTLVKLHGKEKVEMQKHDKKIKYIKRYYVRDEDITNALYGGDRTINRKCLVWYVTGHWREYKTGKKVFIKGYWKGALRNTPPKDTEPRERELVITNEST